MAVRVTCGLPPLCYRWNTVAQLSDTGDYLAYSGQDYAYIYNWSVSAGAYTLAYQVRARRGCLA